MVDLIDRVSRHTCGKCRGLTTCVWGCQTYHDTRKNLETSIKEWLSSFDTNSATKCFEAVNLLKEQILEVEE